MQDMYRTTPGRHVQLRETCRDFAGIYGCPWSGRGEDGKVRFEPVPGWTAEKVPYIGGRLDTKNDFTYQISTCPLYRSDGEVSEECD